MDRGRIRLVGSVLGPCQFQGSSYNCLRKKVLHLPLLPSKWLDLSTLFTDPLFSRVKIKTAEDLLAASARGWRGEKRKKIFSFSRSTLVLALRAYSRVLFDF